MSGINARVLLSSQKKYETITPGYFQFQYLTGSKEKRVSSTVFVQRKKAWTSLWTYVYDMFSVIVLTKRDVQPPVCPVEVVGNVSVKPGVQLWNCFVVKPHPCLCNFWHQQKGLPRPTTKGRGREHVLCVVLPSGAVENPFICFLLGEH